MDAALDARLASPLHYFLDRLHQGRRARPFAWRRAPARVTRMVALELPAGRTEAIPHVDASIVVHCARGSVWLTHDGDCKDVVLAPGESYRATRRATLRLHALAATVLEIQFDDVDEPLRAAPQSR